MALWAPAQPFATRKISNMLQLNPPLLPIGATAPDFQLLDQNGRSISLKTIREKHLGVVLLYLTSTFLAKDLEMLRLYQDSFPRFEAANIAILALSGVNWEKLHQLAKKEALPFPLLFDPCCRRAKEYKTMFITKFVNARSVFAIDKQGKILLAHKAALPDHVLSLFS